jgi:hypothetical protein
MMAKQISENEAAAIASDFFHSGEGLNASKLQAMKVSLAYEFKSGNETMMYAFNNGIDGYVLVSGDDTIIPVLGYSDKGDTASFINCIPINNIANPINISDIFLSIGLDFDPIIYKTIPIPRAMDDNILTSNDTNCAVTVVPILAPIITPIAWYKLIIPALTKPTTITVVAPLL